MANISVSRHGLTTLITITRPQRRNAICRQTALDLQAAFEEFDAGEQRVAVITGEGNDAFSSGADVADIPEVWRCTPGLGIKTEKPIIAATAGWVVGGALVLATHCDLIVSADNAKFSYPEGRLGLTGGLIAGLAGRVPHKAAMDVMLLGRPMSAQRAYDVGMINDVVPVGKQVDTALEHAAQLCEFAPMVLRTLKRFVNDHILVKGPSEIAAETMRQTNATRNSQDREEGVAAFREKRKPNFTGR
ncbi:enoyl-CoA hydratase/isomerase family protein [Bordetella sp. BOR01]|uniref:enoyl-CoA hydratase/isomerase family protein n=1 Tax=Bordetella sp. BOR01 TaxID=2854779 RepID=UPI001C456B96|nr:enoyl-CoA hydratase-related protein [Bordetella sp. BOR01]MBV7486544.1 enoyl-CoA hydratase/isomerase family protein [Bordetella sp. BOR01]